MHMDLMTLWFFVIPGWFIGVGVIFALIFGSNIMQHYNEEHNLQHKREPWKTYDPIVERIDREARHAPLRREVEEEELVGSH